MQRQLASVSSNADNPRRFVCILQLKHCKLHCRLIQQTGALLRIGFGTESANGLTYATDSSSTTDSLPDDGAVQTDFQTFHRLRRPSRFYASQKGSEPSGSLVQPRN